MEKTFAFDVHAVCVYKHRNDVPYLALSCAALWPKPIRRSRDLRGSVTGQSPGRKKEDVTRI